MVQHCLEHCSIEPLNAVYRFVNCSEPETIKLWRKGIRNVFTYIKLVINELKPIGKFTLTHIYIYIY